MTFDRIERQRVPLVALLTLLACTAVHAQTTAFTYQGELDANGTLADGSFDLRFALFPTLAGGAQIGGDQTVSAVPVSDGLFTVQLDFGNNAFPGANRFLEISVRPAGSGSFTMLAPRQQISSTPYAIRTLSAATADGLSSSCVGCVKDTQIENVSGSKVSGAIPAASVPSGSGNYIQNTTTSQANASFNVAGNGTVAGTMSAGAVGVGTATPPTGVLLAVNGPTRVTSGGSGGFMQLGTPGGESGLSISGATSRADLRFNDTTLKLVAGPGSGPPGPTSGVSINTSGAVGIGTDTPPTGVLLAVNGPTRVTSGGSGGYMQLGSPGSESGLSIAGATSRADLRFNDTTLKLVAGPGGGPPGPTSGLSVNTAGSVGIGIDSGLTGRLHVVSTGVPAIYAQSDNRAVWGHSTGSSRGVYGDSVSGEGVHGESTSGTGVAGVSHGPDGVAVVGANDTGGTGVLGISVGGFNTGFAMVSDGHAKQTRDKGGWVKAMAYVDLSGSIVRCYTSQDAVLRTTGDCGFSVDHIGSGVYHVDFGFLVADRFVIATAVQTDVEFDPYATLFQPGGDNVWGVEISDPDKVGGRADTGFMIVVL